MSASTGLQHSLALRHRLLSASRFLKPPGKFKRAELREKPRILTGPFENPVRRFVRLREKARAFDMLPPPRIIPVPKTYTPRILQSVEGVPKVNPAALERRLEFLLSEKAEQQQLSAKLRAGITPFQAELFVWERQMIDLRKIYRAQYLQKLAEVTEEEKAIQQEQFLKEKEERRRRKEAILQRIFDDKKRRALLKDRLRIEKKVTQTATLAQLSKRKIAHLYWLLKLQRSANLLPAASLKTKFSKEDFNTLFNRNVSVPDLLQQLGQNDLVEKSIKKKIIGTDNIVQSLLEESFTILPEDEPQFEPVAPKYGRVTARQRAHLMYSGFSDEDKLNVLQEKIDLLNMKIEKDSKADGELRNSFYIQLRDQIEAAKQAFLEKKSAEEAKTHAMNEESIRDEGTTV